MSNGKTTVVVQCGDPRIQEKIQEYLKERGLMGKYFSISSAGGTHALVDGNGRQHFMRHQARVLAGIEIDEVILINHLECRDYPAFTINSNEQLHHISHLRTGSSVFISMLAEASKNREIDFDPKSVKVTKLLAVKGAAGWELQPVD